MVQIGRESGEVDVESDRMGEERRGGRTGGEGGGGGSCSGGVD